jgi:hypothetical protein
LGIVVEPKVRVAEDKERFIVVDCPFVRQLPEGSSIGQGSNETVALFDS